MSLVDSVGVTDVFIPGVAGRVTVWSLAVVAREPPRLALHHLIRRTGTGFDRLTTTLRRGRDMTLYGPTDSDGEGNLALSSTLTPSCMLRWSKSMLPGWESTYSRPLNHLGCVPADVVCFQASRSPWSSRRFHHPDRILVGTRPSKTSYQYHPNYPLLTSRLKRQHLCFKKQGSFVTVSPLRFPARLASSVVKENLLYQPFTLER